MRCAICGGDSLPGPLCSRCGAPLPQAGATVLPHTSSDVTILPAATPTVQPGPASLPGAETMLPGGSPAPVATTSGGSTPAGVVVDILAPGQQFGRYHVIRQLGAGGMGAVYQAWDGELGVAVALKIIRPDTAVDHGAREEMERRFKREIVLARQVTHTNVLRIHDLGEIGGLKYISMPYVEGSDLDRLLSKQGRLPVPRALGYARQMAAGLIAAHAAGVVHRDLKPANAIVDNDDHLYLLDFGIARSLSGPRATMAAGAIGTIDYMAPEQARGQAADQRADIYAFGLILYDLLLGRRRVESADSAIAELMHRMEHAPVPMRLLDPAVPEPLERIVGRCVEPDPERRFHQMTEVVAALDGLDDSGHLRPDRPPIAAATPAAASSTPARASAGRGWLMPVAAAALVVIAAGGWFAWSHRGSTASTSAGPREPVSVLVADFANDTGDPVFDGIVEQGLGLGIEGASFITAYNRGAALRTAETSIKPDARLTEQNARLVALREGVKLVLAGDVGKEGSAYRIRVRVLDPAGTGAPIAERSVLADNKAGVLDAVGRLSTELRRALGDTSVPEGSRAETFTAGSLEAAHAYAQAQELQYVGKRDEAIASYQEAIRLDPDFGRAYSGIATQEANLGRTAEAEKYFQMALARIDRMTAREKYRTRGSYYLFSREPEKARQEFEALAKAFPADTGAMGNAALARFYERDMAAALADNRRALEIYPKNITFLDNGALYAMYAGQFDASMAGADEVLKLNPAFAKAYVARALSQLALNRADDAEQSWQKLSALSPSGASMAALGRADLALYQGRTKDAIALLEPAAAADVAAKNPAAAARKRLALADARDAGGDMAGALREAEQALALAETDAVRFSAGSLFAQSGRAAQAVKLADALAARLDVDSQAYGHLLRAEIALAQKNPRAALEEVKAAQKLADTWPGRLLLLRTYVDPRRIPRSLVRARRRAEAARRSDGHVPRRRAHVPGLCAGDVLDGSRAGRAEEPGGHGELPGVSEDQGARRREGPGRRRAGAPAIGAPRLPQRHFSDIWSITLPDLP